MLLNTVWKLPLLQNAIPCSVLVHWGSVLQLHWIIDLVTTVAANLFLDMI